ncbi:MAG: funZ protein [Nitrospinae bacterium]|nr:funZ protein [Nitrospinota bacterium]
MENKTPLYDKFIKFKNLQNAINEYYKNAFSPEIIQAMEFVDKSAISAEVIAKNVKGSAGKEETVSYSESHFQTNLFYIQKHFEDALKEIKLKENYLLFIDGIDIRPSFVPYNDYLECVKGLANAIWSVNNDFFPTIRDSNRLRVVLLIRPDIFDSLALQNQNSKVRDNCVLLDWRTTYPNYRASSIFKLVDNLLGCQQEKKPEKIGDAWDHYMPWARNSTEDTNRGLDSSFVSFLRFSLHRPRDIITMLKIMRENFLQESHLETDVFSQSDFDSAPFRSKFSDYLLGEIKDHLSFYYSPADYEIFLKFFEFLYGKNSFTYGEFKNAYNEYINYLTGEQISRPQFFESAGVFLQFLYELNVICCIQETIDNPPPFYFWCFRERTLSNISPKIKENEKYMIHYGISKALNTGKRFKKR